jgi:outer membrane protein OmpA-like peptidoglycan-associated protein
MEDATRRVHRVLLILVLLSCSSPGDGKSQDKEGRWAIGVHTGGNLWLNSYNKRAAGADGELSLRYGLSDAFSVGLVTGYGGMKSKEDPPFARTSIDYLRLNTIPLSFTGWFSLAPGGAINPYYRLGLGLLFYQRQTILNGDKVFLPDKHYRTSFHIPAGIGVETLLSRNLLFSVDLGYGLLDTHVDGIDAGKISWYASARVGVTFLIGSGAYDERLRKREAAAAAVRLARQTAEERRGKEPERPGIPIPDPPSVGQPATQETAPDPPAPSPLSPSVKPRGGRLYLERGKSFILKGVNFETDRAALTPESEPALSVLLDALVSNPDVEILIVGHTDLAGSRDFNQSLSFHRAQTVYTWLVKRGVTAKRLLLAGKGADEPIADNVTMQGRAQNRRIEIRVLK